MVPGAKVTELLRRWQELRRQGQVCSAEELSAAFPELVPELKRQIEAVLAREALSETCSAGPRLEAAPDRQGEIGAPVAVDPSGPEGKPTPSGPVSTLVPPPLAGVAGEVPVTAEADRTPPCPAGVVTTADFQASQEPDRWPTFEEPATPIGRRTTGGELPAIAGYELLGVLGQGGMGVVYKANQTDLKRLVALKMIKAGARAEPDELIRFRSEAEAVARLQHPNVVQIYEVGEQNGLPYFSLEFVEGGSLARALNGTPLPPLRAAALVEVLARAIQVAHQQKIIHRDLKPANVLLTADGVPKISDFGLAKRLDVEPGQTQSGAILGTPPYMAPEQATGQSGTVGPATDIYALGAILYELLTGRPPFQAASVFETLEQVCSQEPVSPSRLQPKLPRDLETICLKCLQKEPRQRYASALELADDLHRFLAGEPIQARPVPLWERTLKWTRRRPAAAGLIAACAVAGLSLAAGSVFYGLYQHQYARMLEQEVHEQQRQASVRAKAEEQLRSLQSRLEAKDWPHAKLQLSEVLTLIGAEPSLDDLRPQADGHRQAIQDYEQARDRYRRFVEQRREALYHLTLFTGLDPEANRRATRSAAENALSQFGLTADAQTPLTLAPSYFTDREQAEITAGCYELLLVLAEVVAHPLPGQERAGQAAQALRLLEQAQGLGRPTRAYHLRRARYLDQMGQAAEAERERVRAERQRPASAFDYAQLAREWYQRDDLNRAIGDFLNALHRQPDDFWAEYYLAVCYLRLAPPRYDLAKARLTACLGQQRDFPWVYLQLGYVHSRLGEYEKAAECFQQALNGEPDDLTRYGVHNNRGVLRLQQAEAVEAVANLPHLSAWLPSLSAAHAAQAYQHQKLEEAGADLRQALILKPKEYQPYLHLAAVYRRQKRLDEAVALLDQAIGHQPRVADLYRERAHLHRQRQDTEAALADLAKALQLEPGGNRSHLDHYECASILSENRRYPAALGECEAALKIRSDFPLAHRLRAEALLQLERYPEAVEALAQYEKFGRPTVEFYRARGDVLVKLQRYPEAVDDYTRALKLAPDAATYAQRGWLYLLEFQAPGLALPDFEEALRRDPSNGDAHCGRGMVRLRLGPYAAALADAKEALALEARRPGPRNARLLYNAACIFALAARQVEAKARRWKRPAPEELWQYENRALQLLRAALDATPVSQREALWRHAVVDPDLVPIWRNPKSQELADKYTRRGKL